MHMTADEEKQQHMDASAPLPHCRESSRRSNPVGARLRSEKPPGPAPWRLQHCQRAAGKRPRVSPPPPPGSRGGATSLPGVRPRIRFREPASTTSKKQDIMGVFLLWPRTPFPLHPPPLPSSCFCYMAMVAGGSQRRRVLLVEDNEVNRVVVRRLTREMGMGLEEAENGRVAVELIRQGRAYDLILMDKEMPVMDGHEATRQLRSLGVTTPIVALSGNTLQSDRDSFLEAGADHFEAKPLSRGQFMKILTKYGLHQLY